jgi:hypothetical protein
MCGRGVMIVWRDSLLSRFRTNSTTESVVETSNTHLIPLLSAQTIRVAIQQGTIILASFMTDQVEQELKRHKMVDDGQITSREAEEQAEEWEKVGLRLGPARCAVSFRSSGLDMHGPRFRVLVSLRYCVEWMDKRRWLPPRLGLFLVERSSLETAAPAVAAISLSPYAMMHGVNNIAESSESQRTDPSSHSLLPIDPPALLMSTYLQSVYLVLNDVACFVSARSEEMIKRDDSSTQ